MLEIPGYRFDEATNRYFKDDGRSSSVATTSKADKKGVAKPGSIAPRTVSKQDAPRQKRKSATTTGQGFRAYDGVASAPVSGSLEARSLLKHAILTSALSELSEESIQEPDITLGDTVTRFHFRADEVYYGTAFGLVGHGTVAGHARPFGHSVSSWRTDIMLSSAVTSLSMHKDWMVVTSFGPQAQATFSNIDQDGSGVSITFNPKKTSLWSSSLYDNQMALGGDKKIIYSANPLRSETRSFGTGSAVFALHQQENELLAGTRSGHLRFFDLRTATSSNQEARPEILLRASSSITHIRPLANERVLLALMNGDIGIYDRRFMPARSEPVMSLSGHVNSHSIHLGLDVYNDSVLAAAGEDNFIRLWSLKTGQAIHSSDSEAGLTNKDWGAPVPALSFREDVRGLPQLCIADGAYIRQFGIHGSRSEK